MCLFGVLTGVSQPNMVIASCALIQRNFFLVESSRRAWGLIPRMRGIRRADPDVAVLVPGDPEKAEEKAGVKLNENIALGVRNLVRDLGCDEGVLPLPIRSLPEREAPKHLCAVVKDKK